MFGHKTSLNKVKKTEIIPSIFFDHNEIELEINTRKKSGKSANMCILHTIEQPMNSRRNQKRNKKILRQMKTKIQYTKTYGLQQKWY